MGLTESQRHSIFYILCINIDKTNQTKNQGVPNEKYVKYSLLISTLYIYLP